MQGTVQNENKLVGTLSGGGSMRGGVGTVFGKDGKSAYEVAVKNGYEGTETEWLESLKGEQGEKGDKGEKGADGTMTFADLTPEQKASLKGDKGDKGDSGTNGTDGTDGVSATHAWNGTVLTVTSASGTSSADLKGEKGESGVYVGSGDMPVGCNVQIDPNGMVITIEQILAMIPDKKSKIATVTLLADKWNGTSSPYSQVVSVEGATENSQVDLTPSVEQLAVFHQKDLAFVTENEDGVITVYAIGDKPQNDYTIQATVTEVVV